MTPPRLVPCGWISVTADQVGAHHHVRFRGGVAGQRADLGTIICNDRDWSELSAVLSRGARCEVSDLLTTAQWTDLVAATRMGAQGLPELEDPYRIAAVGAVVARIASMRTYGWRPEHARHLDAIANEAARRAEDADERDGSRLANCDTDPAGILAEDIQF